MPLSARLREVLLQKFWKYHDMAEDVEACHLAREPSHLEAKNSKKGNTVDRKVTNILRIFKPYTCIWMYMICWGLDVKLPLFFMHQPSIYANVYADRLWIFQPGMVFSHGCWGWDATTEIPRKRWQFFAIQDAHLKKRSWKPTKQILNIIALWWIQSFPVHFENLAFEQLIVSQLASLWPASEMVCIRKRVDHRKIVLASS